MNNSHNNPDKNLQDIEKDIKSLKIEETKNNTERLSKLFKETDNEKFKETSNLINENKKVSNKIKSFLNQFD
jgi:hypothetical protein